MKSYFSFFLSLVMLHVFSYAPFASETPKEKAKKELLAAQVKAGITEIGAGKSARVRIVLDDKTKYDGYIFEIAEDHFVVADARSGATAPIAYSEVKGIKGHNLSTGAKIGIGVRLPQQWASLLEYSRDAATRTRRPAHRGHKLAYPVRLGASVSRNRFGNGRARGATLISSSPAVFLTSQSRRRFLPSSVERPRAAPPSRRACYRRC